MIIFKLIEAVLKLFLCGVFLYFIVIVMYELMPRATIILGIVIVVGVVAELYWRKKAGSLNQNI